MAPIKLRALLLALVCCTAQAASATSYVNAEGYRNSHYRAPTPAAVAGGTRIDTHRLLELIERDKPLLIDVLAAVLRPELAEFGDDVWLVSEPRRHLPNSVWLPNVGYGELDERMQRYFRDHLRALSGGDLDRPLVIYCVVDCWMSWNAARRAAGYGYRQVYWYPQGSDGWRERGLPLAVGHPLPLSAPADDGFFSPAARIDLGEELGLARAAGQRGLLLFFETDDCPFCQRMRRDVLSRTDVRDRYRRHFRALALDSLSERRLTGVDGTVTTQAHFARRTHRIRATPTLLFYDLDGAMVYRHVGIVADPNAFLALADYVLDGRYLEVSFREYYAARR